MKGHEFQEVRLADYRPPTHSIGQVQMKFELFQEYALVSTSLKITRPSKGPLSLAGEELELLSIQLDGKELPPSRYQITPRQLSIESVSEKFTLQTQVRIYPQKNKALKGLYKSGQIFCTQCEAEGFRRITYFLDRPDVMSKYQVRIEACETKYPCLLSNGNLVGQGKLAEGRHFVEWEDPFKKPSYLFALVAGDLGMVNGQYTTMSGRKIALEIYCDKGNESRCHYALECLKKAMQWEEEKFKREYDLDVYMIVAVEAFNMGAMENKGLNIFTSSCILADSQSATDYDYKLIEGIIAHEYFHNWTGNRVTCRDWFQLTLKEGLTVYRDQEFSSDMQSRPVKRIEDVKCLKQSQFPEDAGPMAHPIRPQSYIEVDNFYTATVYLKGAEVIRMVVGLIGKENFYLGMEKYFELYDGKAVTTEDFIHAMEVGSGQDLGQFKETWYNRSGTPVIDIQMTQDQRGASLAIKQSAPKAPENRPFLIPFPVAFYSKEGHLLEKQNLKLSKSKESFHFPKVTEPATPSFNLDFAAPVKVSYHYSDEALAFLMKFDQNPYNRFEAAQRFAMRQLLKIKGQIKKEQAIEFDEVYFEAYGNLLEDEGIDMSLKAYALGLPSFVEVIEEQESIDFEESEKAIRSLYQEIARRFYQGLCNIYRQLENRGSYQLNAQAIGQRLLKNTALAILAENKDEYVIKLLAVQYQDANNMTDKLAALQGLSFHDHPERKKASDDFYQKWHAHIPLYSKWLMIEAQGRYFDGVGRIKELMKDKNFDPTIPEEVALLFRGLRSNPLIFYRHTGEGHRLLADFIKDNDQSNPLICAGLTKAFSKYPVMKGKRKAMVKEILLELKEKTSSKNTYEIIEKLLQSGE